MEVNDLCICIGGAVKFFQKTHKYHHGLVRNIAILVLLTFAHEAHAAGTPAGTLINNNATVKLTDGNNNPLTLNSNVSTVRVNEILDVQIVKNDSTYVTVNTPDSNKLLSFTLTNTGNGPEKFILSANTALGGDQFNPVLIHIVLDTNGNGIYDAATDTNYSSGSNDPILNPNQSLVVFLISDIPAGLNNGDLGLASLTATAATGSGAPGTRFPGAGVGGSDAIVGATHATATSQNGYALAIVSTALTKTQVISDPFGQNNPVVGAVITYTLTFAVSGTGNVTNSLISDSIPASTSYVAGSLTLNGTPLTDVADADAGRFTGTGIEVSLGILTAPTTQIVTFKVIIN